MNILLFALIASLGINLLMFIPAYILQTDKITDISYAVTFMFVATAAFIRSDRSLFRAVLLTCVLSWSVRLGLFLLARIMRMGRDHRFDDMRNDFFKFLRFWLLQGASVFVVMLAVVLALGGKEDVTILSIIGLVIFIIGLLLEATADQQKNLFSLDKRNKGIWIDRGVWRASRHPNYLGEMLVWVGLYVAVLNSLDGWSILWAALSPLYIIGLLLFVSGVPLLEKAADAKWGKDEGYRMYKKSVPVLIPTLASIRRAVQGNNIS